MYFPETLIETEKKCTRYCCFYLWRSNQGNGVGGGFGGIFVHRKPSTAFLTNKDTLKPGYIGK